MIDTMAVERIPGAATPGSAGTRRVLAPARKAKPGLMAIGASWERDGDGERN